MKYFCSKCGKTTLYNLELPKFCSCCGQSFANKSPSKEVEENRNKFLNELKLKKNTNASYIEEDSENFEENPTNFNINFKNVKPSFTVDIYKNQSETFGSLIENPTKPNDINFVNNEHKTPEQVLQEFQKEAGLSRIQE